MKIIPGSRRRHYVAGVCIFLITASLIAVIAGCGGGLRLTITSTEGGKVTSPGEGTFTYDEGMVVDLVAEPDEGYRFIDWTGYVPAIADITAAATNITVNGHYSITANFALEICLEIQDWYDLDAVRDNLCVSYILMNDLDSNIPGYEQLASPTANGGRGWEPIGDAKHPFRGIFDGRGYEICDLFISRPSEDGVGFFGSVGEAGAIKDIGVVNVTVVFGDDCVGGLVGYNRGTVSNCYSTGNVTGDFQVGGLVGRNYGTVRNSYWTGSVTGDGEVGGLVGGNEHEWEGIEGTVSDCYSTGSVTGEDSIGGLVGGSWGGTVNNSYSTGSVTGEEYVGGLLGFNSATVSNSYSTGSVTGYKWVGGLVGDNDGPVSNSFYNYDEVLIKGESIITIGALFNGDFNQWLTDDKSLDVNERLSQEGGYYVINDVADFKQLLAFGQDDTLKFRLINDLDLAGEPNFYIPYLAGEFDGNGHRISNLSLDYDLARPLGLFGYLAPGGKVTQVGVENVNVTATSCVGGLVGKNDGTVSNCHSTGSVNGGYIVGGLVGNNWGAVSNCYVVGSMTGNDDVGGVAGYNAGDVTSSYSTGTVTGGDMVGGLAGQNDGTVSNSYSIADVTGEYSVGGLVGFIDRGTVSKCYATGNSNGDSGVGGLVGDNYEGTVSDSFWDTQTSGQATSDGGAGKTTAEMRDIATFSDAGWKVIAVANAGTRNPEYTWNIVDKQTYPFLSWQPVQ
jgi:hypothetical protein